MTHPQRKICRLYPPPIGGKSLLDVFEAAGSQYYAEMATKYATDVESLLRAGKPLDKDTKAALAKQFEAAARKSGQESWNKVLGPDSAKERR